MASYAVTQDPARVPLTQTALRATVTLTDSLNWPRKNPYSIFGTGCAYKPPGDDSWANQTNEYGPFFWAGVWRPWAFFSYQLQGTSQILGSDFVGNPFDYTTHPRPWYLRGRVGTSTIWDYGANHYECLSSHGIAPLGCYVLRPSTNSIVGWLFTRLFGGGYGGGGSTAARLSRVVSNVVQSPGPVDLAYTTCQYPGTLWYGGSGYNVTGIQDGDLLVWEFWANAHLGANSTVTYLPSTMSVGLDLFVGGGEAGQPLTVGTEPNWAPAWGVRTSAVIPGVEPSPPRPIQCSVGF